MRRGGVGADGITGDGAGIMTEIPYQLFEQLTEFKVPGEGYYAVGLFFSKEKVRDSIHEEMFNQYFESEGFKVIGYRDVPVDTALLLNMLQILCLIFNKYLLTSQV